MNFDEVAGKTDEIADELAALRRERPKPAPDPTAALLDLLEAVLSHEAAMPVDEAVDTYMEALNAHIDRRVSRYMRGAGELAP